MLFLCRVQQWNRLQHSAGLPEGAVVASADYDLTQMLRISGVDVVDLFSLATEEMTQTSLNQAWSVANALRRNAPAEAELDGCNLVELTANEVVFPWCEVFFQRLLINACLARYQPQQVYGFPEMAQSYQWDFPVVQPPDIFNATVANCAVARGLQHCVVNVPAQQPESDTDVAGTSTPLPYSAPVRSQTGPYRTICFAPKFAALREMRVLIDAVRNGAQQDWLVVTDSGDQLGLPTLRQELLLSLPFELSEWSLKDLAVRRDVLLHCLVGQLDETVWRVISHSHFGFVWGYYNAMHAEWDRWYSAARFLVASTNVSAVVVGYDIFATNRIIEAAFAKQGVPVMSIDHVGCGVDPSQRRNTGAHAHVAVWGQADRLGQTRWRGSQWQAVEVGTLRTDHAFLEDVLNHNDSSSARQPLNSSLARRPRIVFFTSKFATSRSVTGSIDKFERSWAELLELVARRSDWDFVLKPHPSYDHHMLYGSKPFIHQNLAIIGRQAKSAQEVLATADVAILINCASTTAIDAVGLGVPVLYLKDASWPGEKSPIDDGLAKCVGSVADLEVEIARLVSDRDYRAEVIHVNNASLSGLITAAGRSAVDRAVSAIESVRTPRPAHAHVSALGAIIIHMLAGAMSRPDHFARWAAMWRSQLVAQGEGVQESLILGFRGAHELRAWVWTVVIERCQRTSSSLRALVFFISAWLCLPSAWRPRGLEILRQWRRVQSKKIPTVSTAQNSSDAKVGATGKVAR